MVYSRHSHTEDPIKDEQRFWKRILIIDDDDDTIVTFKAGIEDTNNNTDANKKIEVHTSNNPVMALSGFKPNFYDLLLFDINMPHMNGFELSEKKLCCTIHLFLRTLSIRLHLHSNKHVIQ
jgi:PleD family two-component response regulator